MRPGASRDTTTGAFGEWSPAARTYSQRADAPASARFLQNQALQKADALPSGSPTLVSVSRVRCRVHDCSRPRSERRHRGARQRHPVLRRHPHQRQEHFAGAVAARAARSCHRPAAYTSLTRNARSAPEPAPFDQFLGEHPQAMFSTETVRLCLTNSWVAADGRGDWRGVCILPFTSTSTTIPSGARRR